MSDEPIQVFDLEAKLADDTDGSYRRALVDELATEIHDVKRQLNAGLPPDEYKQATAYLTALEKATGALDKVSQLNKNK